MFSKEQSKKIRQEFWTNFGKTYPRKWLLYNTKIKDVSLKFTFNTKIAQVSIDIESPDDFMRSYYFDKLMSLKNIIKTDYLPNIVFDENYSLDNGKIVSRIYVELDDNVNIHNKNTWERTMDFLNKKMNLLESFFIEYKDFIED